MNTSTHPVSERIKDYQTDIVYIDPPWGGTGWLNNKSLIGTKSHIYKIRLSPFQILPQLLGNRNLKMVVYKLGSLSKWNKKHSESNQYIRELRQLKKKY